jgi:hypothetical protein
MIGMPRSLRRGSTKDKQIKKFSECHGIVQTFWSTVRKIEIGTRRLLEFHQKDLLRILVKLATSF